ncbi:uncharacterized protein LOC119433623 [Dermacentor silvarum]|uniref:uncharacterized protein LOC119433623 n=1 Tax=Dermacentor silvarum TaxID=543639 RepID=UPI00189C4EAD|nr:uncharacterized protein LOC119433623 [Dermacentor silvarum]
MTERFHRQLKAAIMCHPNSTWLEALSAVALGLRATFKPDIQAMPANLTTGTVSATWGISLRFNSRHHQLGPYRLCRPASLHNGCLCPSPVPHHTKPTPLVFKDLATCSHAFLRDDTVRAPFQPPYSGPYQVLRRDDKTVTLQINLKDVRVSIDRLTPSYILSEETPNPCAPPVTRPQQRPTPRPVPYTTRFGLGVFNNPLQP